MSRTIFPENFCNLMSLLLLILWPAWGQCNLPLHCPLPWGVIAIKLQYRFVNLDCVAQVLDSQGFFLIQLINTYLIGNHVWIVFILRLKHKINSIGPLSNIFEKLPFRVNVPSTIRL